MRHGIVVLTILCALIAPAHAEFATYYGGSDGYCGKRTANGEVYNCAAMTAAHRSLAFGTYVTVCGKSCATVRINDRGPYAHSASIDLSMAAARTICGGLTSCHVRIMRKGDWNQ